jgi:site-specific DNA-methyltransferase (adenine-specific)
MPEPPRNVILQGDAAERLAELPSRSVECVITSPPYFAVRDYGVSGQLGREATIFEWVANLRAVFSELSRALSPWGGVWLNVNDTYSHHPREGAARKGLLLGPERLLLALADDGWRLRNRVIWAKSNPVPHSVTDRLNNTYEFFYFLVRSRYYHFDLDAIREPHRSAPLRAVKPVAIPARAPHSASRLAAYLASGKIGHRNGRNPGDVWRLPTSSYRGAHFATFPAALVEKPLLASCPEEVCTGCGMPAGGLRRGLGSRRGPVTASHAAPPCTCNLPMRRGVVLDPFFGSGTVGEVAQRHGRDWLGIELSPEYIALARERLGLDRAGRRAA